MGADPVRFKLEAAATRIHAARLASVRHGLLSELSTRYPAIQVVQPVRQDTPGLLSVAGMQAQISLDTEQSRLYVLSGSSLAPKGLADTLGTLLPSPHHPMRTPEAAIDSSGQGLFVWADPSELMRLASQPGERAFMRLFGTPTHVYWVRDGDYLIAANLPQALIDRGYITHRTRADAWLRDSQRMDPRGALLLSSMSNEDLPAMMYRLDLELLTYLGDLSDRPVDMFALPTPRKAGLPEQGAFSAKISSSPTQPDGSGVRRHLSQRAEQTSRGAHPTSPVPTVQASFAPALHQAVPSRRGRRRPYRRPAQKDLDHPREPDTSLQDASHEPSARRLTAAGPALHLYPGRVRSTGSPPPYRRISTASPPDRGSRNPGTSFHTEGQTPGVESGKVLLLRVQSMRTP